MTIGSDKEVLIHVGHHIHDDDFYPVFGICLLCDGVADVLIQDIQFWKC